MNPNHAHTHNNLGIALKDQGQLDAARECFERAVQLQPDYASARWNLSLLRLLRGDLRRAWPDFECRWQLSGFVLSHEDRPRWDGSSLQGKTILLYAEQGLGDTIQFIRYARLVKQRGGNVLCECPPLLLELLMGVPGIDQIVATGHPLPPYDVRIPLLSLPGIFETTLATIPAEVPYLQPNQERVERWRQELSAMSGFKVGIVWQGSPTHENDRQRSVPLERFAPLAQLDDVRLVSLQVGAGTEQLAAASHLRVIALGNRFDLTTLADAAAVLQCLDLVVTVDTAAAHLAGALGVPVWVVLSAPPEWRWLLDREDSPWYSTMRLFRQHRPGDWEEVFVRVAAALREKIATDKHR